MAEKILGPHGSKRRKRFLWVPMLLVACTALFYIAGAQAVHATGAFELDGDATSLTATPATNDWDRVCHQETGSADCGTTSDTSSPTATAVSWTGDCPAGQKGIGCGNLQSTIFTGGGSKDPQDINNWAWKDGAGGLPDKDNLIHGFSARFSLPATIASGTCPNGTVPFDSTVPCQVLYFGSDRFDNSGDAQQGFWFFQNKIDLGTNTVGGGTGFTGVHKDGDLLVISDFSVGGTTSTITAFKWDSTCTKGVTKPAAGDCADTNLRLLATSDNAKCASGLAVNDPFCGLVNPADGTTVPWSSDYTDKSGNSSTYLQGELYEGGINLSLLGLANECFSTVGSETRSSTSTTATLKDFILGQFAQCVPSLTTQASNNGTVAPGAAVHDTATVQISGTGSRPDPTGTVTFFLCGPSAASNPTCTSDGSTFTGNTGLLGDSDRDGVVDDATPNDGNAIAVSGDVNTSTAKLAPGFYCFRATWPGDTTYPLTTALTNPDNTNECFRVQDTSSMTTAQDWIPNDSATVSSGAGTALTGNVVFTLYDGSITCATPGSATVLYGPETKTLTAAASGTTVSTSNTGATAVKITSGTGRVVTWKVVFTSTDGGVSSPTSATCETTTITSAN